MDRLGIEKAGLYMQHWPGILTNGPFNDAFVEGLGDCARLGLTQAVGVSNFSAERVRRANSILQVHSLKTETLFHDVDIWQNLPPLMRPGLLCTSPRKQAYLAKCRDLCRSGLVDLCRSDLS